MADWQTTAKALYCDAVAEYVTLIVYSDGSATCTGYKKYYENTTKELKSRAKKLGRQLKCEGLECSRLIEYKNKLFAEEAKD